MKKINIITYLCLLGINNLAFTQIEPVKIAEAEQWNNKGNNSIHFNENNGQILQTDGTAAPFVSHVLERGNTHIYLLKSAGIAYQFNRMHYPEGYQNLIKDKHRDLENLEELQKLESDIQLETYRMDMHLVNANPATEIIGEGKSEDYTQYYNRNALDVHHYKKVIYKNVYPNIDWEIYTTPEGGMKYDFIVHPGGDPKQIQLQFTHQEELYIDQNGNLIHGNRMGRFTEKAPVSFQNGTQISSRFILKNNIVTFDIDHFNPEMPLTIDPDRIWGTYYGGTASDRGYACSVDPSGNVYLAGRTVSNGGIATSGGHQTTNGGGDFDAFLVKFNASGVRQWASFYGGSGEDVGVSCATDASGNVYLCGTTESITNISTSSSHQTNFGGGRSDAFLAKFTSTGKRVWATYYGGDGNLGLDGLEYGESCATDLDENIYLIGTTYSDNNISSNNVYQNNRAGVSDVFLVKFNSTGVRQWGTYYGGTSEEFGGSCATDANGYMYLTGVTASTNGIASTGAHQTLNGGYYDAFLAKFSSSGSRIWSTYYGGELTDFSYSTSIDDQHNVYICGLTESTSSISFNGHQNVFGGSTADGFLVKFDSSGTRLWGTYYGGKENDFANSCAVDKFNNVYLAGSTSSSENIATFSGHQSSIGGESDAFLVKFNTSGVRLWGSYYGGSDIEGAKSVCFSDTTNHIYLAGSTNSNNRIFHKGFQNDLGGTRDAFLVQFNNNCEVDEHQSVTTCVNTERSLIKQVVSGVYGIGLPQNLPDGVHAKLENNVILIAGKPTIKGIYEYTIPLLGDCDDLKATGTITVNANTVSLSSAPGTNNQTVTLNTSIDNILYTTIGATGIGAPVNLPPGVTAAFVSNVISISGVPSELGTFNYSIPLTGGCGDVNATGTITVTSTTSTQNLQKQPLSWKVYPNPNNGQFTLESQVQGQFDLMDVNGKTIQSYLLQPNSAMQIEANLPAGVYFIKEKNKGSVQQLVVY